MPRIARMIVKGEPTVYHIISRSALDGYALDMEVVPPIERFQYRTRYFSDSGIIGKKEFVEKIYHEFKNNFSSKHEKKPRAIRGLDGLFSLKRLSEK